MLILPIINKNRILNVCFKLKNTEIIGSDDVNPSDIVINNLKFSNYNKVSQYDFIVNNAYRNSSNIKINTLSRSNSKTYDIYKVSGPVKSDSLMINKLYDRCITDIRKMVPDINKGRYLVLSECGFDKITDGDIASLESIVRTVKDSSRWSTLIEGAGLGYLIDIINGLNMFEGIVIDNSTVLEDDYKKVMKVFNKINSRDKHNIDRYYSISYSNMEIYNRLNTISKLVTGNSLNLIKSKRQLSEEKKILEKKDV